jgi:hypothetical protein
MDALPSGRASLAVFGLAAFVAWSGRGDGTDALPAVWRAENRGGKAEGKPPLQEPPGGGLTLVNATSGCAAKFCTSN